MIKNTALALIALLAVSPIIADWTLNNDTSELYYLTTKNTNVTELNTFKKLSGNITSASGASVIIDLTSVETFIPIRNERMQEMFFNTDRFPTARIAMAIDHQALEALEPGQRLVIRDAPAELTLHGDTREIKADLVAVGLQGGGLQVSNLKPIVVKAEDFGLLDGVEALRAIVNIESITNNAPVNFTLVFDKD